MEKNTPLSSLPSSEHEMESKGKHAAKNREEAALTEPSVQVIRNIKSYSKALNVKSTKSALKFVEYITN